MQANWELARKNWNFLWTSGKVLPGEVTSKGKSGSGHWIDIWQKNLWKKCREAWNFYNDNGFVVSLFLKRIS